VEKSSLLKQKIDTVEEPLLNRTEKAKIAECKGYHDERM
jgi:hypothetical protein